MNQTIHSMNNHRSIRKFLDKPIDDSILNEIIKATQSMPTSNNGQQVSIIIVRDKNIKSKLSELSGNQPWINKAPVFMVFIVDFYKSYLGALKHKREQIIQNSVEGIATGILDSGIALGGAIVAAESLGLGTVAIGGVRQGASEVIRLLNLPQYTLPINGLCIGHIADMSTQKPRLNITTFAHHDSYHMEHLASDIDKYDLVMQDYLVSCGRSQEIDWSNHTSNIYKNHFGYLKSVLLEQGFDFN
jgi:FMN reductase [NAD(P)H]